MEFSKQLQIEATSVTFSFYNYISYKFTLDDEF